MFESYTQGGKSRSDGTGLGLPLSRRLIELMGGDLDLVASTPAGTTFRIRIAAGIGPGTVAPRRVAGRHARPVVVPS